MLSSIFRHCARCGSYWGLTDLYCEPCWLKVQEHRGREDYRLPVSDESAHSLPILYLWNWNDHSHRDVGRVVYCLKGGGLKEAYRRLAHQLMVLAYERNPSFFSEPFVFVPSPPRENNFKDHAWMLGSSLAQVCQSQCISLLEKTQLQKKQKALSKKERGKLKFKVKEGMEEEFCSLRNGPSIIFVDDVITTGSTVRAAYTALKSPNQFYVWGLALREEMGGSRSL